MSKNVGIVSTWFARGSGQIAKQIIQAIQWHTDYSVSLLARMSFADNSKKICFWDEYFHTNILLFPTYEIDSDSFEQWVKANDLSTVIFIEEQHGKKNLVSICNKLGVMSCNYIVWEAFNPSELSYYRQFTNIICPTESCYNKLSQELLLNNTKKVLWGVDLDLYTWQEPIPKQKPVIFFPAGYGGVADRKNEESVLKAFSYICPRDRALLHVHTQQEGKGGHGQNINKSSGTVDTNQLIQYYKEADLVVLPSRWEGNGLPFMESLAIGRPIITVDAPPMNERIINNINGLTCKVTEMKEVQGIFVKSAEIDCWYFAEKMIELSENKEGLYEMQLASRKYAEVNLDWKSNSKYLIDILA